MRRQLLLAVLAITGMAIARPYRLPQAGPQPTSAVPEAALTAAHCSACHSFDYILTQPPGKGHDFWQAEVTKMVTVYGADIPAEDAKTIASYLAQERR